LPRPAPHQLLPLSDLAATQCFDSTPVFSITSLLFSHFCHTESPVIPVESMASAHFPIMTEGGRGKNERSFYPSYLGMADLYQLSSPLACPLWRVTLYSPLRQE